MIEPTESASLEELDSFIDAMIAIDRESECDPDLLKTAPHRAARKRLDEVQAARRPVLRWSNESSD
jgi:glycine dehydrogenase subunit 2